MFSNQKSKFGYILEDLGKENVGLFACGYLGYTYIRPFVICYCTFGNLVVIWYILPPFWYIVSRKIWQPWVEALLSEQSHRPLLYQGKYPYV
jgi:hypothetical protein